MMKRSTNRKLRSRNMERRTQLESLETRQLLAVDFTSPVSLDDGPMADTALLDSSSTASGPVAYIVNGQQTNDFPEVGIVNGGCSGTLISPTHVLTAAHCVEGISDTGGSFTVNGQTYQTTRVISHPDYNPAFFDAGADIAIMVLNRPVVGVEPAKILRQTPQVGQVLTLVGFGMGGTTGNPIDDFGTKRVGETPIDEVSQAHIIWNFSGVGESNTAPGDSGGPAFVTINGERLIAGVTSGGDGDPHTPGDRSFDTRVDIFADWIDGIVGGVTPPTNPNPNPDPDPTPGPGDPVDDLGTPEQLAKQELADYDEDGNGALSVAELTQEFLDLGDTPAEAQDYAEFLVDEFDVNSDRELDLQELIASWGGAQVTNPQPPAPVDPVLEDGSPEQLAKEELANYDTDGNGALSVAELTQEFLDYGDSHDDAVYFAEMLVAEFDVNGDLELDLPELIASWGGNPADGGATDPGDLPVVDPVIPEPQTEAERLAAEELDLYDANGDGALSLDELVVELVDQRVPEDLARETAELLIAEFDSDGNELLSFAELVRSWGGSVSNGGAGGASINDPWNDDTDWWLADPQWF